MKRQIFAFIFAMALSMGVNVGKAYAQFAEAIVVDVPFAFKAKDKTLPAGTYRIDTVNDSRFVWRIRRTNNEPGHFLMARNFSGAKYGNLRLTFRRYGDRSFLVSFKTPSYEIDLPTSSSEKALRRNPRALSEYRVITIETKRS